LRVRKQTRPHDERAAFTELAADDRNRYVNGHVPPGRL
jgi:hypothetical protein